MEKVSALKLPGFVVKLMSYLFGGEHIEALSRP
jgi:hypothetical protein